MLKWLSDFVYPEKSTVTHYFTGPDCQYSFQPNTTGERGMLFGTRAGLIASDYILLPNGSRETRYQILGIKYVEGDKFKAYLKFAPRDLVHAS